MEQLDKSLPDCLTVVKASPDPCLDFSLKIPLVAVVLCKIEQNECMIQETALAQANIYIIGEILEFMK